MNSDLITVYYSYSWNSQVNESLYKTHLYHLSLSRISQSWCRPHPILIAKFSGHRDVLSLLSYTEAGDGQMESMCDVHHPAEAIRYGWCIRIWVARRYWGILAERNVAVTRKSRPTQVVKWSAKIPPPRSIPPAKENKAYFNCDFFHSTPSAFHHSSWFSTACRDGSWKHCCSNILGPLLSAPSTPPPRNVNW